MITRELLLQKRDLARKEVAVPGLDGSVFVRNMTAGERDRFEQIAGPAEKQGRRNYRALIVAFSACDEAGARLFTEADLPALAEQSVTVIDPIAEAAAEVNGFSRADVD